MFCKICYKNSFTTYIYKEITNLLLFSLSLLMIFPGFITNIENRIIIIGVNTNAVSSILLSYKLG